MIKTLIFGLLASSALAGSAVAQNAPAAPQTAKQNAVIAQPVPSLAAKPAPKRATKAKPRKRVQAASGPKARVASANDAALREPTRYGYLNAIQVYPFEEGQLYRLFASPERVTDIALQAGERLTSVAAGDTVRWIVGDTTSGSGANARTHILVKPSAPGLSTNLVISTDRRVYHLALESTGKTAMVALSWNYPADALMAIERATADADAQMPIAEGLALDRLNFDYRITGDDPPWRPLRAFDDGRQTFIAFPTSIGVGEAPPLFVTGAKGEAQLVNYRMRGTYYVVDRLFDAAELRLGQKDQDVVHITRGGKKRRTKEKRHD
jgi:type IV secretion system protein TrbG